MNIEEGERRRQWTEERKRDDKMMGGDRERVQRGIQTHTHTHARSIWRNDSDEE